MYTAALNKNDLRQGDVIQEFLYCLTTLEYHEHRGNKVPNFKNVLETGPIVIISQCCDIPKRDFFYFVPLIKITEKKKRYYEREGVYEKIRSNTSEEGVYNLFYYEPSTVFTDECLIDFSNIMYAEKSRIDECKANKCLELTAEARHMLRLKIHANFCRLADEDIPFLSTKSLGECQ